MLWCCCCGAVVVLNMSTEPRVATGMYSLRAASISFDVSSAPFTAVSVFSDVFFAESSVLIRSCEHEIVK